MSHKGALEAVERTLRDIHGNSDRMGKVTVVLSGDFRQTLPVIKKRDSSRYNKSLPEKVTSLAGSQDPQAHR